MGGAVPCDDGEHNSLCCITEVGEVTFEIAPERRGSVSIGLWLWEWECDWDVERSCGSGDA